MSPRNESIPQSIPHFTVGHNFLYGSDLRVYNDDKRFYGQVVHETRSTTIHGFEQSELDVIIDCIGKF